MATLEALTTSLPDWLSASPVEPVIRPDRSVLDLQFTALFEHLLDRVTLGHSLSSVVKGDMREFEAAAFLRWVKRDAERTRRLREAQEIHAEVVASEVQDLADDPTLVETRVLEQRIAVRRWLASVHDRKRFGDRKEIDITQSIDIRAAMSQAQSRLIEGELDADALAPPDHAD